MLWGRIGPAVMAAMLLVVTVSCAGTSSYGSATRNDTAPVREDLAPLMGAEITSGDDELGVLLLGHDLNGWCGRR